MAAISKHEFLEATGGLQCCDVIHPWHSSCIPALLMMLKSVVFGYNKFALIVYSISFILKWKKMNKDEFKLLLRCYLRTGVFGLWMSGMFVGLGCLLRQIAPFSYYTVASLPAFVGGLGIFFEHSSRRNLLLYSYVNMFFEVLLKHLEYHNIWKISVIGGLTVFTVLNGLFMYIVKKQNKEGVRLPTFWFFTPPATKHKDQVSDCNMNKPFYGSACSHEGSCEEDICRSVLKLSSIGYAFGLLKAVVPNIGSIVRKPAKLLKILFQRKTFSFGLFAGLYVALYKISNCLLCRTEQRDCDIFALLSGLIAGLAFWFLPSPALLSAILSNLAMVTIAMNASGSKIPVGELIFALINAALFHNYAFYHQLSPRFFSNMIEVTTHNKCFQIYNNFLILVRKSKAFQR